ncbi:MAG: hypothetical protein CMJ52_08155 [Planctomycetaceae bacterium]|nr:hypothetical protein [Planctomycetaceae bacterium]
MGARVFDPTPVAGGRSRTRSDRIRTFGTLPAGRGPIMTVRSNLAVPAWSRRSSSTRFVVTGSDAGSRIRPLCVGFRRRCGLT